MIQSELVGIGRQIAIIDEIFEDFSDDREWDSARENNRNNKSDESWTKRKRYLNFTLQQLVERQNLLLREKISLSEKNSSENGLDIKVSFINLF